GGAQSAAAAAQLVGQVQHDAGARHADGVAQRDRAAVDVDDVCGDAQVPHGLQGHAGERLVDLDQVEVGDLPARLGERVPDRVGRLGVQRVVRSRDVAVRADLGEDLAAQLLGLGPAHDHDRAGAVGDLGGGAGGDGALRVEGGAQPGEALGGGVGADALVGVEDLRLAPALRDLHRHDLVLEPSRLDGGGGALVGARGEGVLLLPGEAVPGVVAVGG